MSHTLKEPLYGKTLEQLQEICAELKLPRFNAKQIARWLYVRRVQDLSEMTDLSLAARSALEAKYSIGLVAPIKESVSQDGTKKYLFQIDQNSYIEAAYIPDGERATLCVSSQVGCRMGCRFCATGRQGLQRSLSTNEILNQILSIPESQKLTNLVFMGMGEPLDNMDNVMQTLDIITSPWGMAWSPTRITLSTAGVGKNLRRFLEQSKVHLAISLHNPFHDQRKEIMPIENAYPIQDIMDILKEYDFSGQRRVSFEYIVMEGLNDSHAHIKELCRLLNGVKCRINLIRFHKIPDSPYFSPNNEKMIRFRDTLTAKGIQTTIRASRGEDIKAACGLLSTAEQAKNRSTND